MVGSHGPDKAVPPSRDGGCTEAGAVAPVEALGTLVLCFFFSFPFLLIVVVVIFFSLLLDLGLGLM